ncbi:MAG: zinc ribbon domain-containing protein [Oscillospiraceae bacterium]|nr:zinc ribbon domain-containing protein [Oscillospiraceae bacterium]
MGFCTKCGAELSEGFAFCAKCGAPVMGSQSPGGEAAPPPVAPEVSEDNPEVNGSQGSYSFGYSPDQFSYPQPPVDDERKDAEDNKLMAIIAYLGPLALVTWFAAEKSKFARFHAKEGIKLLIAWLAVAVVRRLYSGLIGIVMFNTSAYGLFSILGVIGGIVFGGLSLLVTILALIGIVNAAKGEKKAPPIAGKFELPFLNRD